MSVNCAIVRGVLSSLPEIRVLASGTELATLQVTTRPTVGAAVSVPVSLSDPPAWVAMLSPGDEVVALGVVRRRFFRAGGATASRVEIDASKLVRASDKRGLNALTRIATAAVDQLSEAPTG